MRPVSLEEFSGQKHILSEGKLLWRLITTDTFTSLIFFGPPGTGKTTLASIIAGITKAKFERVNAVSSNVAEIRDHLKMAKERRNSEAKKTILFVDEIHRFNKAQQDVLMPAVEEGDIVLIGATVHNPAFSIISPLLSRSHVFEFKSLSESEISSAIIRGLTDKEKGLGRINVDLSPDAIAYIAKMSEGDARRALNILEIGVLSTPPDSDGKIVFDIAVARESSQKKMIVYDKDEDGHYDTISAFIKSMRGSDPDAAVYWLAKMIEAGEDPRFIARRIIIFASEDIGNADPHAVLVAVACAQAVEFVGLPEARINLAQAVCYLATAPKSNASYMALENAGADIKAERIDEVPRPLKNKHFYGEEIAAGKEYKYAHNFPDGFVPQDYRATDKIYYHPTERGYEKNIKERLEAWRKQKSVNKS